MQNEEPQQSSLLNGPNYIQTLLKALYNQKKKKNKKNKRKKKRREKKRKNTSGPAIIKRQKMLNGALLLTAERFVCWRFSLTEVLAAATASAKFNWKVEY